MKPSEETVLEQGYDKDDTQQQRLITVLSELEDEVEKQNSFRYTFVKGALHGLGTVIGATILIALLGSVVALTLDSLGEIPFLSDFIRSIVVEQLDQR